MYNNLVDVDDTTASGGAAVQLTVPTINQPQQTSAGLKPIFEDEKTKQHTSPTGGPGSYQGGRRLSIPFSEQRRKSSYGVYSRVVMCSVDASEHSRDAFNWYLANIWKMDDLIVICYCPEPPSMPSFTFKSGFSLPTEKWKEIIDEANDRTRKLEEDYEQTCVEKKLRYKIRGESFKPVGEGICKIAEDENANLIVIGSRGLGTFKRALMGSVSEYVVRNSRIPVLVVPQIGSRN